MVNHMVFNMYQYCNMIVIIHSQTMEADICLDVMEADRSHVIIGCNNDTMAADREHIHIDFVIMRLRKLIEHIMLEVEIIHCQTMEAYIDHMILEAEMIHCLPMKAYSTN